MICVFVCALLGFFPAVSVNAQTDSTAVDTTRSIPRHRAMNSTDEMEGRSGDEVSDTLAVDGDSHPVSETALALELSGFIVDETQTKLGRDFYEYFYNAWITPNGITEFTIVISEKPLPQRGTQVTVMVNDLAAYQAFLQPRLDVIEENAEAAIERAKAYLTNYQDVIRSLQGDDMEGSGIF